MRRGCPLQVVLVAVALGALDARVPIAEADDDDVEAPTAPATAEAKRHFDAAEALFSLRRFEAALAEYEAAYRVKPLPAFMFNIAQCHRNLGNLDAAIFSFRTYLRLSPDAVNRAAVNDLVADLERERASRPLPPGFTGSPPPPPKKRPLVKRWYFWTGIAVGVAAVGTGTYLLTRPDEIPDTNLGTVVFPP